MKAVFHTMQAVRAALQEGAPLPSTGQVAVEYAQFSEQARQRLESVITLLQKGNEYQALQIAEEEPPLLDLLATLNSGEEPGWASFCQTHGLRPAARVNPAHVRELEALYARGASASHPLYKDFRAAVLARDDARALKMVRMILKLNPADSNARQELERLEHKQAQEHLEQLKIALKTDDEEHIASLTEAIQALDPAGRLERLDVYEQGLAVRRALRKRQLRARLPEIVAELTGLQKAGAWQALRGQLETLRATAMDYGLDLAAEPAATVLNDLEKSYADEKVAEARQREFEKVLKEFESFVNEVEQRLQAGAGMSYEETVARDETFLRRWKELDAFKMPVVKDRLTRLTAAGQGLRAHLQRLQRGRRLRKVALAAVIVVGVFSAGALGMHRWKAHALADELAAYQAKAAVASAEQLVRKIQRDEELLLRWPRLQAKTAEVAAWTAQARATETQAREAVLALEASFASKAGLPPPAQLLRQMTDAGALVAQVAEDIAPELRNRLAALLTRQEAWLAGARKEIQDSAASALAQIEPLADSQLSYEQPASQVAASLAGLDKQLIPLEMLLKPEADVLQLPAALESRILAMRERLVTFRGALDEFEQARSLARDATTLEDYTSALMLWKKVRFAEAAPALPLLAALPTQRSFQAALLTGGDEQMLTAVLEDASGRFMTPETSLDSDKEVLLSLMADATLNDIWEHTLETYGGNGGTRTVWSRGQLKHTIIGDTVRWTGQFYDPATSQSSVGFIKKDFSRLTASSGFQGQGITGSQISGTSAFMNVLQINRVTDENGERIVRSLLDVFEKLMLNRSASPVARAYIILRLEMMAARRPQAWGMHLCPSLQADLHGLHQLLGQTVLQGEDWLLPATRDRWTAPLADFFATCAGRGYFKEATVRREFLRAAAVAGLKFGGYVETDLSLILNQSGRTAAELWVISQDGGRPLLIPNHEAAAGSSSSRPAISTARPLSPVFFIPVDRRQLVQRYTEESRSPGAAKPALGDALLLTAPPP
ncbi:MAG: hypothetical protein ACO1TE_22415 [Prosthecobacter sp.]